MKKSDIGILFDVSGSMRSSFNSLSYHNTRADEIINVLDRICTRGNRLKNEQIRVFSILFGGNNGPIYDFCNLLEISNKTFKHNLSSDPYLKASKKGYGKKISDILSENGRLYLYLDNFLYCESGPTERLCEMGCYLLEDDYDLRNSIYQSLPAECKSFSTNVALKIDFFGFSGNRINKGTTDVINDIYKKCINKYISKIISEEILMRKNNGNKLRFIDGNDLVNIKNNLEGKITSPDKTNFNIIDLFKNYIYGGTPLFTALNIAFDNFKNQSNDNNEKYLFILSDGELTDVDKNSNCIQQIIEKAKNNKVTIISIFLTSKSIPKEETLYDTYQSHFTQGSKDLFLMSSTLNYESPVIKFLIQKGWKIPSSGESKLFVEINNSQNLNKFIELMNEAIGELNNRNNIEIAKNPNSLVNLLSSTAANDYVNSKVINQFTPNSQTGGTCYANATAASICFASARVLGRPKLKFGEVLQKIIDKFGYKGGNVDKVLQCFLDGYRLHYKKTMSEEEARKAIMLTRPCITIFHLTGMQWGNFSKFYKNNPKGILTKEIINENYIYPEETPGGHAVVLTHISKEYLKFLNSWGKNWGDSGYFKIKDIDVLGPDYCFYDIFWYISDLNNEEITYFNNYIQNLKKEVNDYIFN